MAATVEVAPGLWQIAVPVPFSLRCTYAYAVALTQAAAGRHTDWVVVDLGPDLPSARRAWLEAEAHLGWMPGAVRLIVITHAHWEHLGLAAWAQQRWGAPVALMEPDLTWATRLFGSQEGWQALAQWYMAHGLPEPSARRILSRAQRLCRTVHLPERWHCPVPGESIAGQTQEVTLLHQPGHTDGNLVAYLPQQKILLAGDQVLARVTPNIGIRPQGLANPLGAYLKALEVLRDLEVTEALPAHEQPVRDLPARVAALGQHHRHRLARVLAALDAPKTGYEVLVSLFGEGLSAHHLQLAMDETLAHLEYLRHAGQVCLDSHRYRRLA
ncbi:MAG: MBL fold metallo-hydrolase [Firmicutes bacterium]|nr:MBL fold metallo-hydrolase [Bacillota bacterium]